MRAHHIDSTIVAGLVLTLVVGLAGGYGAGTMISGTHATTQLMTATETTTVTPQVYEYMCMTPCGLGMGVTGYMDGYVIVTS